MGHGHCNGSDIPPKPSGVETHDIQNRRVMLKFVPPVNDVDARVARLRIKVAEKCEYQMAEERDIKAAHVLMDLANCVPCLPEDMLLTMALSSGNMKEANRLRNNGQRKAATGEKLSPTLPNAYEERKQKKREVENVLSPPKSKKYRATHITEEEEKDNMHEVRGLSDGCEWGQKTVEAFASDSCLGLGVGSLGSKMSNKHKTKADDKKYLDGLNEYGHLHSRSKNLTDEPASFNKKSGLQNRGANISDDASIKPEKRLSMITPTLHTEFSFSVIHLLSAVRIALMTQPAGGFTSARGIQDENTECIDASPCESKGVETSKQAEEKNVPSLNLHRIVLCVRLRPGDPRILETQEPLIDLVREVMKIFSCRTAPLGAKGWKPLTTYSKSSKRWSWIGPVSLNFSMDDCTNVDTASEAWRLPHITIVKMVDCFANWLKKNQEALERIGCLPSPPLAFVMQPANAEDRFKALKSQRSLITISPSSDQARAYFHEEEIVRYLIPERPFSYTALDGRKSVVAPLRRCSGKPLGRAKDHFMLKINRPPHVTVLCLVRDAVGRLPGKMGTRADVCTLIRDSQYIVDGISDVQVNQVVSGALDRLHYEVDPCVKFDRDRHLWVYLHGEREEEDFESGGCCSSRRKCKGQQETIDGEGSG